MANPKSFNNSISFMMLAMVVVLFVTSFIGSTEAQTQTCAQNLIPCADDLNKTTTPSETCCNSIKNAVTNDLQCLCSLYNTPGLLPSLGVNVTQALQLATRCGVNDSLSACNSAAAPSAVPPPPDNGHGVRMTWAGVSYLLLLGACWLFY